VGFGFKTEEGEDLPVTAARREADTVRLVPEARHKEQRILEWCRRVEDPRMGDDSQESAQNKIRQAAADRQGLAPEEVDMVNVEAFYVLDGTYIDGTLDQAIAEHGSMEAYIRDGVGLTDKELEQLRHQLLE